MNEGIVLTSLVQQQWQGHSVRTSLNSQQRGHCKPAEKQLSITSFAEADILSTRRTNIESSYLEFTILQGQCTQIQA